MEYYNRWNDNYESLYSKISVFALGGYSTTMFLQHMLTSDYAKNQLSIVERALLIEIIEKLEDIEFVYNNHRAVLTSDWFQNGLLRISEDLVSILRSETPAFLIQNILVNEFRFDWSYPFISWYNDGFVDLNSQLGKISLNYNDSYLEYKGFKRISNRFTISNSDINKVAHNNYSIVHNLETRHKDILD